MTTTDPELSSVTSQIDNFTEFLLSIGWRADEYVGLADKVGNRPNPKTTTLPIAVAESYVDANVRGRDWYFSTSPLRPGSSTRQTIDVARIANLILDIDRKWFVDPATGPESLIELIAPHFGYPVMVNSGGGLHNYWPMLSEVVDFPVAKAARKWFIRWASGLALDADLLIPSKRGIDRVQAPAFVLRVPATRNTKPEYGSEGRSVTLTRATATGLVLTPLQVLEALERLTGKTLKDYYPGEDHSGKHVAPLKDWANNWAATKTCGYALKFVDYFLSNIASEGRHHGYLNIYCRALAYRRNGCFTQADWKKFELAIIREFKGSFALNDDRAPTEHEITELIEEAYDRIQRKDDEALRVTELEWDGSKKHECIQGKQNMSIGDEEDYNVAVRKEYTAVLETVRYPKEIYETEITAAIHKFALKGQVNPDSCLVSTLFRLNLLTPPNVTVTSISAPLAFHQFWLGWGLSGSAKSLSQDVAQLMRFENRPAGHVGKEFSVFTGAGIRKELARLSGQLPAKRGSVEAKKGDIANLLGMDKEKDSGTTAIGIKIDEILNYFSAGGVSVDSDTTGLLLSARMGKALSVVQSKATYTIEPYSYRMPLIVFTQPANAHLLFKHALSGLSPRHFSFPNFKNHSEYKLVYRKAYYWEVPVPEIVMPDISDLSDFELYLDDRPTPIILKNVQQPERMNEWIWNFNETELDNNDDDTHAPILFMTLAELVAMLFGTWDINARPEIWEISEKMFQVHRRLVSEGRRIATRYDMVDDVNKGIKLGVVDAARTQRSDQEIRDSAIRTIQNCIKDCTDAEHAINGHPFRDFNSSLIKEFQTLKTCMPILDYGVTQGYWTFELKGNQLKLRP